MRKHFLFLKIFTIWSISFFISFGCAPVQQNIQPRAITPAYQSPYSQTQEGVSVAAEPYIYSGQGLDYCKAGIYPLRVTFTNQSNNAVMISSESVLLLATDGNLYMTYLPHEAVQLVINSNAMEEAAKGALTGAVTGAVIGALVGLTVGAIFKVHHPERLAGATAVYSGVGGAAGGMQGYLMRLKSAATHEINSNALRHTVVAPGMTTSGWLFFPGQVIPKEIRIAISEANGGRGFRTYRFLVGGKY